jgi:2-polyprenyl-3-methyl-5-hydroxy-6-metoxy-1,4-benzoquinol methylase
LGRIFKHIPKFITGSADERRELLRRVWTRRLMRRIDYADNHRRLNALYYMKDPWGFTDPREEMRFTETNRILLREFGHVRTLLEVGCAEGHQTLHLMRACGQLYGLDVSAKAVRRAKRRCPGAMLEVGDLTKAACFGRMTERFDVVVACEVIYYIEDVTVALQRLAELGRACLVTYYSVHRKRLDHELARIKFAARETIHCEDRSWSVVWWRNDGCMPVSETVIT